MSAGSVGGDTTPKTGCPSTVGCHPPKDRCNPVWVRALVSGVDLPGTPTLLTRVCTSRWLVLDILVKAHSCVSMGGDASLPGCGPTTRMRWFAESRITGWTLVAAGGGKGCAEVQATVPSFPSALCRQLPALAA
jgi:hypothetical protein